MLFSAPYKHLKKKKKTNIYFLVGKNIGLLQQIIEVIL